MTPIPFSVVVVVLCGALCHASWNAVVKRGADTLLSAVLVAAGCGAIAVIPLPFLPQPDPASWPFIIASVLAQVIYMCLLAATYQAGDMSQTYPVMRGTAPLMVALASGPFIGESLSAPRWAGVALISGGVAGMALIDPRATKRRWAASGLAVLNAGVIATYTVIDGIGVRRAGQPVSYGFWTFILTAIPLVAWAALRRRRAVAHYAVAHWRVAVFGGAGTLASYSLALWAMTVAPVAVVASLRETAILFATAISALVLKEKITPARLSAIGVIVIGAAIIRGF